MARSSLFSLSPPLIFLFAFLYAINPNLLSAASWSYDDEDFSIIDFDLNPSLVFHQGYSPPSPSPPPPPPHAPAVTCDGDLGGIGSLDTKCRINSDLNLTNDVYISGNGSLEILSNTKFQCLVSGCSVTVNISGNFTLGVNSSIFAGTFELLAFNATFSNNSSVTTTGLGGDPPPQTSGTPTGIEGAGGGHGGRGAACLVDKSKLPEDVWGGDAYSWSSLQTPWSYGSKGGSTSKEADYGGGGGGRVKLDIVKYLEVDGSVVADGGDGGRKGGGGSGGSIHIKAHKM